MVFYYNFKTYLDLPGKMFAKKTVCHVCHVCQTVTVKTFYNGYLTVKSAFLFVRMMTKLWFIYHLHENVMSHIVFITC